MKLNLQKSVIENYYNSKSKRLSNILTKIESIESWVLDRNKTIYEELISFADVLNNVHDYTVAANSKDILQVLAYLSCSKAYFFMTWLDENYQKDIAVEFMDVAKELYDESSEFSIHIERLDTVHKMNVLGNIFSEKRMSKIIQILESVKEEIDDDEYQYF